MTAQQTWLTSPREKYRLPLDTPAPRDSTPLPSISGPAVNSANQLTPYHPESPMFWVGVIALATFGLMAVSGRGSIRLGPLHAAAEAGAGKDDKDK